MDAAHGSATAALKPLNRGIREYSLFQGVLLVLDRLRQLNPGLDDEALYERLEFQANPSLGFPGSDIEQVQFFQEHGEWRARLRINLVSLQPQFSCQRCQLSIQTVPDNPLPEFCSNIM